jgi:tetratricopeptide (TPR) repeat protein/predicted aspartyl protease
LTAWSWVYALVALASWPLGAAAACKVTKTPDLPITMSGLQPMVTAKINGADAQFVLDSGAFYSMISAATAAQFKLPLTSGPPGLRIVGVGGSTESQLTRIKLFTFAGIPLRNIEFLVGGSETGSSSAGLLGQNFLESFDVEYDLGRGAIRLLKAEDCKHTMLAYWAGAGQSVSTMDISWATPSEPHTVGTAFINDSKIRVLFDTGAGTSMITLKAAARAGVTLATAGVVDGGYESGIGRGIVKSYIAPFRSFKIGDNEEIKNARLRIADTDLFGGDMLIGADFFLSHRVYVANSQHRLYFTYNGGPVFNLEQSGAGSAPGDGAAAAASGDQPADAATFFRRGAALAGQGDFAHAIEDFSRAVELNGNEPEYFHQRGMAYWRREQPDLAKSDFDRALTLDRDYLPALVSRAQFRVANGDRSGAAADVESADRIAAKQADIRYSLGQIYEAADSPAAAIAQYGLWIQNHPDDAKMAFALSSRCWARALLGTDLAKALGDCDAALRRTDKANPAYARMQGNRGLVQLRLGAFDKSIADYDASLKSIPKNPWSLYGRGIAKSKLKRPSEGEADMAAAAALYPQIADRFARYGIAK